MGAQHFAMEPSESSSRMNYGLPPDETVASKEERRGIMVGNTASNRNYSLVS